MRPCPQSWFSATSDPPDHEPVGCRAEHERRGRVGVAHATRICALVRNISQAWGFEHARLADLQGLGNTPRHRLNKGAESRPQTTAMPRNDPPPQGLSRHRPPSPPPPSTSRRRPYREWSEGLSCDQTNLPEAADVGFSSSASKYPLISSRVFASSRLNSTLNARDICLITSDSNIPHARASSIPSSSYIPIFKEQCRPCSATHARSISTEFGSLIAASGMGMELDIQSPILRSEA